MLFATPRVHTQVTGEDRSTIMAFLKDPTQRAADERAKASRRAADEQARATQRAANIEADAAREAAADEARQRKAFLASPVGQASTAKAQGQGFFEIQLQVGSSQRDSTIWGDNFALDNTKSQTHVGTLAAIERVGWRLEHVGHVFVVTSESSRDKFLSTGQQTAVSGNTIGIYLFRSAD